MASAKREQLIETALKLFYRQGFHATGIDAIIAESGVARMTLYKHFKSKDDLILAVLRRRDERFRIWFTRAVERRASSPGDRLLAVFDALEEWFRQPDFSGCMFINASAEFADPANPIHKTAAEHKILMRRYLTGLARDAGAPDPEILGNSLALLAEGAIVMRHVGGDASAATQAGAAAAVLIKAAMAPR